MRLELLAITRADAPAPPHLRRVSIAGLAAIASDEALDDSARLAVLRDLMAASAVLPARRGVAGEPSALAAFLAARAATLNAALRKVGGCVEIVASVTPAPEKPAPPGPPSRPPLAGGYLRARAEELALRAAAEAKVTAIAVAFAAAVRGVARDTAVRGWSDREGGVGADACVLVTTESAGEALDRLSEAAARLEGARAKVSGPWPPFSFTDLALGGRSP